MNEIKRSARHASWQEKGKPMKMVTMYVGIYENGDKYRVGFGYAFGDSSKETVSKKRGFSIAAGRSRKSVQDCSGMHKGEEPVETPFNSEMYCTRNHFFAHDVERELAFDMYNYIRNKIKTILTSETPVGSSKAVDMLMDSIEW